MGYYTGSGETTGGGETDNLLKSFWWYGAYAVRQKCVTTVTRIAGVSEDAAKSYHSTTSLTNVGGGSGDEAWIIYDAEGSQEDVAYSQIGGSNLYEVTITRRDLTARLSSTRGRSLTT